MNKRLSLSSIAQYLRTALGAHAARVGTTYDQDYLVAMPKTWPAVWVGAQRYTALDGGRTGGSSHYHQRLRCDVTFRLVVQRYVAGQVDAEARLNDLHDRVAALLRNYRPADAWTAFAWVAGSDGPAYESVCVADMTFAADLLYTDRA